MNNFFFDPENKGPKYENFGLLAVLTGAFGYYLWNREAPSEEITYQSMVNDYLIPNNIRMVTISEDASSDMFKFRAQIETQDGGKVHLVLPQIENFLFKLDQAQRELGRSVNEFVSVKYASSADSDGNQTLNYLIGASFVLMLV